MHVLDVTETWRTRWTVCWKMLDLKELSARMVRMTYCTAPLSCLLAIFCRSLFTVWHCPTDVFTDLAGLCCTHFTAIFVLLMPVLLCWFVIWHCSTTLPTSCISCAMFDILYVLFCPSEFLLLIQQHISKVLILSTVFLKFVAVIYYLVSSVQLFLGHPRVLMPHMFPSSIKTAFVTTLLPLNMSCISHFVSCSIFVICSTVYFTWSLQLMFNICLWHQRIVLPCKTYRMELKL